MIESPDNDKLKLVRRLARRKSRDEQNLFVTEGEDLLAAGREAGREPEVLLTAPESGLGGDAVNPALLDRASALGSGTRAIAVWERRWADDVHGPAVYLHGVSDPGNVGTIVRTAGALAGGTVVLGPGCADPWGPKAVRATMGACFTVPMARGEAEATPEPRAALAAHGGEPIDGLMGAATVCLGAEREGLPAEVIELCDHVYTIPLQPGAESLNVAAAAAIALHRMTPAGGEGHA